MSTHDPLVFAGLERSEVRIFRRDGQGKAIAEVPDQDPRGMGVAAILTSDLFRLRSTLDSKTQSDLDRQRVLLMKQPRTKDEDLELVEIEERIRGRGLSQSIRDPLYEMFIRAWTEREDPAWTQSIELTPEQQKNRAALAKQIVTELQSEETTK